MDDINIVAEQLEAIWAKARLATANSTFGANDIMREAFREVYNLGYAACESEHDIRKDS